MKKILTVTVLVMALVMLIACTKIQTSDSGDVSAVVSGQAGTDAPETEFETDTDTRNEPEAPDTTTSETGAPPEEDEPEADVEMPDDFRARSLEELVTDLDGTDGTLPFITLDCSGADAINEDIAGRFGYLTGEEYCNLHYECFKGFNGRILSVLVVENYDYEFTSYMPYNLDLVSGSWISGEDLLELIGVSRDDMEAAELGVMGGEFEYEFGSALESIGQELYDEQLARTVAPENAVFDRVWLGYNGQLMFVAKIYGFAGAEFYEYPMAAGYAFP